MVKNSAYRSSLRHPEGSGEFGGPAGVIFTEKRDRLKIARRIGGWLGLDARREWSPLLPACAASRVGRADGWQEPRGVFDQLLMRTSERPVPGERTGAVFSLSSSLCVYMRALGFFFLYSAGEAVCRWSFAPLPPSHLPAELLVGCSLAYVSVKMSKDLPRNDGRGKQMSSSAGRTEEPEPFRPAQPEPGAGRCAEPSPALRGGCGDAPLRDGPQPPRIAHLSGRGAGRGEVTVTDAGSKPGSLCSLARGLIAALCCSL